MPNRNRPLHRRSPKLQPRPRLLIICEGKLTEPSYFRGFKDAEKVRLVDVVIDDEGGTPKTLVERAVIKMKAAKKAARRAQDKSLEYDQIWCVFDVDEHPKLMDARQQANAHKISLAVSNPCFELWLLLHFRDQRGWMHRHDAQCACREQIPGFDKEIDFRRVRDRVDVAIQRAIELDLWQTTRGEQDSNPSTTVHKLVQRLKNLGKAEGLNQIQSVQVRARIS
jgi:RloB-like protein